MVSRSYRPLILMGLLLASCNNSQGTPDVRNEGESDNRVDKAKVRSWINIRGTIASSAPSSFILRTASGDVTVEMDDWDWYQEGRALRKGYEVVVTGRVDDDILLNRTVEARSVFVKNIGTYYYASGSDEESLEINTSYATPAPNYIDATGTVLKIGENALLLRVGSGSIAVDISGEPQGLGRAGPLSVGDRLYVWGDMPAKGGKSLKATGLIKLVPVQ